MKVEREAMQDQQLSRSPLLEIEDLSVSFASYESLFRFDLHSPLHRLNLKVYPGELVAVIGQSGAGKSLLAESIMGILPRNARRSGNIHFAGQPLNPRAERGRTIRYIPQSISNLDPTMTVKRFVAAVGWSAEQRLSQFGIEKPLTKRYPQELSGGQLRRVLLATAVDTPKHSGDMRLLIADEPTPGLHKEAAEQVLEYFNHLKTRGVAVMIITHDMVAAAQIADRIIVLNEGRMEADFPAEQLGEINGYTKKLWDAQPSNKFWDAL